MFEEHKVYMCVVGRPALHPYVHYSDYSANERWRSIHWDPNGSDSAVTVPPKASPGSQVSPQRGPGLGRARRGTQLPREPQEDIWSRSGAEGEGLVEMSRDWGREGSVASGGCLLFSLTRNSSDYIISFWSERLPPGRADAYAGSANWRSYQYITSGGNPDDSVQLTPAAPHPRIWGDLHVTSALTWSSLLWPHAGLQGMPAVPAQRASCQGLQNQGLV